MNYNTRFGRSLGAFAMASALLTAGCENSKSGSGLDLDNIGDNNPATVVCLGDSITDGVPEGGTPFPARLGGMIGMTVINEGYSGEHSTEGAERAMAVLKKHKPAAVTILYGANDLIHGYGHDTTIEALRGIIQAARENKTVPVLATLTPMVGSHGNWGRAVTELNTQIRALASSEGVQMVDLEKEFGDTPATFMIHDGLHPNDAGNELIATAIAQVFLK